MRPESSHSLRIPRRSRDARVIACGPLLRRAARWTDAARAIMLRGRFAGRTAPADRVFLRPAGAAGGRRLSIAARIELHVDAGRSAIERVLLRATGSPQMPAASRATAFVERTTSRIQRVAVPPVHANAPGASAIVNLDQHIHTHVRRRLGSVTQTLDRADAILTRAFAERRVVERAEMLPATRKTTVVVGRRLTQRAVRQEVPAGVAQVLPAAPRRSARSVEELDDVTIAAHRMIAPLSQPPAQQAPAVNVAQITDHVIDQLDRRMRAWRERLGQV